MQPNQLGDLKMQINIDGLGKNSQECGFFWREVADHIFEELHLGISQAVGDGASPGTLRNS